MTSKAEAALLQLRKTVQPPQRDLLTALWDYYVPEGLWMPARELHHQARGATTGPWRPAVSGGASISTARLSEFDKSCS